MKRITYLKTLLVGLCAMVATSAWAADPDLVNDYTLVKSVTWGDGVNIAASGECAHTAWDTGNKQQQKLTILTAPEAAAGWIAFQSWTNDNSGKGWWNRADKSLYCVNAGRSAAVFGDDLTTGWLVVFECTQTASNVMSVTRINGDNNPDGTFTYTLSEDGKTYFCTITAAENAYVGFYGNKNALGIKKISVYKPNKAAIETKYTVKYQDMDGNTLKDDEEYDGVAGTGVSVTGADKANITKDDVTYVYDSDDSEGVTVAEDGSTVVIVKFHVAANFSYTVNEVCGGTVVRTTTGTSYETATVKVPYRKYNVLDGVLYKKDATNKEYNFSFNLTEDNTVKNIDYTATDVTNVIFCSEAEDIEGLVKCNSSNAGIRSSNSAAAYAPNNTILTSLSSGTYQLKIALYDANKTPNSTWTFLAGDEELFTITNTTVNFSEQDKEITLTKPANLVVKNGGGNVVGLDALYITSSDGSIIETVPLSVELGTTGYSTFSSPFAVEIPSDVTAYTAEVNEAGTYVNFTEVEESAIPAKTGVLLKGNANASVDFNIISSAAALSNKNDFKVNTSGATFAAAENTTYFAMVKDSDPLKFGTVNPSSVAIPANKAYLAVVGNSEARLTVTFDGETTAIKSIENAETSNAIYNLNGQRVEKAQKGLYIVNGKKTIVK